MTHLSPRQIVAELDRYGDYSMTNPTDHPAAPMPVDLGRVLAELVEEACAGAIDPRETWITDPQADMGLLGVCRNLPAERASQADGHPHTIAGHLNHIRFALDFGRGHILGHPSHGDWSTSWQPEQVSQEQWRQALQRLREAIDAMRAALSSVQEWDERRLKHAMTAVAHSAYHLGAVRARLARQDNR